MFKRILIDFPLLRTSDDFQGGEAPAAIRGAQRGDARLESEAG